MATSSRMPKNAYTPPKGRATATARDTTARVARHRRATVQWVAVFAVLGVAIVAAVVFGSQSGGSGFTGGGHGGLGFLAPFTS